MSRDNHLDGFSTRHAGAFAPGGGGGTVPIGAVPGIPPLPQQQQQQQRTFGEAHEMTTLGAGAGTARAPPGPPEIEASPFSDPGPSQPRR